MMEASVRDWTELADVLKKVRSAEQKFLGCWVAEEVLIRPGVDRVATDITNGGCNPPELSDEYFGGDYLM
jgi:hypothetical protein